MNTCAICRNHFEAESPAVLFVSAYGTKRVLCENCEALLDRATMEEDSPEKIEARKSLENLAVRIKDPTVLETLGTVLSGETDENALTPEEEEEMEAVFEDIRKEEEEELANATPQSSFWDYLPPILFGVALLAFVVFYFFL